MVGGTSVLSPRCPPKALPWPRILEAAAPSQKRSTRWPEPRLQLFFSGKLSVGLLGTAGLPRADRPAIVPSSPLSSSDEWVDMLSLD